MLLLSGLLPCQAHDDLFLVLLQIYRNDFTLPSKKWFHIADTYGVEIGGGQNDILILAITVAVDMMAHGDDQDSKDDDKGGLFHRHRG